MSMSSARTRKSCSSGSSTSFDFPFDLSFELPPGPFTAFLTSSLLATSLIKLRSASNVFTVSLMSLVTTSVTSLYASTRSCTRSTTSSTFLISADAMFQRTSLCSISGASPLTSDITNGNRFTVSR